MAYLYVIGPKSGREGGRGAGNYAVGLTKDPKQQLAKFQEGNADPIEIIREFNLETGYDSLAETVAKRLLSGSPNGAWYRTTRADAMAAVDRAVRASQVKAWKPPHPDYGRIIKRLRNQIFGTTQTVFAEIAGVSPSIVSRWESGELVPGFNDIHRLRTFASANGLYWQDQWLHEVED